MLSPVIVALFLLLLITSIYGDMVYRVAAFFAFVGHIFVSIVLVPIIPYGWDIGNFHDVATGVISGELISASSTVTSFGTFQGFLYIFFPADPTTVGVFNGLFSVLIFIPVAYLCQRLYPGLTGPQYGVMSLILFIPLPFYLLSLPMRDALSILLVFTLLSTAIHTAYTRNLLVGLSLLPLWAMMYLFRPELALVFLVAVGAATAVWFLRTIDYDPSVPSLTVIVGIVGIIGVGIFAEFLYSLERANSAVAYRARGGAVYLEGMQYSSWFDFILIAPTRAIYFQFAPFPLHVEQVFHLLAFTMTPIVIVLFICAVRSLYECEYDETVAVLLVVFYLAGITGYGLINSNFGTNVRHRIVFDFLLVVMAAPVIKRWELQIGEWLGISPRDRKQHDKQQREAYELDRHVNVRSEHTQETGD